MRKYSHEPEERAAEEQCERDIQSYGLHILKVTGDEEWPEFAYTVGLFHSFNHPEVIVLGLPGETAQAILNNLADVIRTGKRFAAGEVSEVLLENYACKFLAIPPAQVTAHFGWAFWYYGDSPFPTLQLVYPDREHRWPWDKGVATGFLEQQPILSTVALPGWATR